MKEEVKRIMKLVQEGKLSPDDAAELIEAFNEAPAEDESDAGFAKGESESTQDGAHGRTREDPVSRFIGSIEKIGKDVAKNVNWEDIAVQVRQGVSKGVEAVKHAAEEAKKSGGFSMFFGAAETKTVELPLEVPKGKTLRIETGSGDVTVEGGAETGSLLVTAVFRSYDDAEAKRMADEYTPVLEESEHMVLFRQAESTRTSADVVVKVPKGVPVEVKVGSGDVKLLDTGSSVKVDGVSGDVKVTRASGAVNVAQRSGDVRVEDTKASVLSVETKSGNIVLDRVTGVVELKTSSGDVTLLSCNVKTLSVEAASGDISVDLAKPVDGTVNITAVSGDVSIGLLDGSDCRVSLSTLKGTVSTTLQLQDETKDGHKVTGRLGAGIGSLDVSVVTGDVSLSLRDSSEN